MSRPENEEQEPSAGERKSRARAQALRALGRREQSGKELRSKLIAQGFDAGSVGEVLQDLTEAGWQSDRRYAEMLLRSRIAQGYGPRRIEAELSRRGVDAATILSVIADSGCDWTELAGQVYRRRFKAPASNLAERQKRYRFLAARGFSTQQLRAALKFELPDEEG